MLAAGLIAKVLGSLRDYALLSHLGASVSADAIAASTTIPDLVQYVALGGLIGPVIIPHLARARVSGVGNQWPEVVGQTGVWSVLIAGGMGLLGAVSASGLIALFSPGLAPETQVLATQLLAWSMALLPLIGLAAVMGAVLQSAGNVGFPAFAALCLNAVAVVVVVFGADRLGAYVFVAGLAAGTVLQVGMTSWAAVHYGKPRPGRPRFQKELALGLWSDGWRISTLALIWYGRVVVERVLAAAGPEGTLANLNLVTRVIAALAVVASTSIGTAMLPEAIAAFQSGRTADVNQIAAMSFRLTLAIGAGIALCLALLAGQLSGFAFQRTALSPAGIETLRQLLILAAPGIVSLGLSEVNTRLLLSVRRSSLALGCAILGGFATWSAQWVGQMGFGVVGIVFGGVIGTVSYATLTTLVLIRTDTLRSKDVFSMPVMSVAVSVLVATAMVLAIRWSLPSPDDSLFAFILTTATVLIGGGGTYLAALNQLRFPEWRYLKQLLRS